MSRELDEALRKVGVILAKGAIRGIDAKSQYIYQYAQDSDFRVDERSVFSILQETVLNNDVVVFIYLEQQLQDNLLLSETEIYSFFMWYWLSKKQKAVHFLRTGVFQDEPEH